MHSENTYFDKLKDILEEVANTQAYAMESASGVIARCVEKGNMVYTFGTGHSSLLAMELFYRAGGLAQICPITDERLMLHNRAAESTYYERLDGIGEMLVNQYPVKHNDVFIIMSNSGRNSVTVELAIAAKKAGAVIIALTNLAHSRSSEARNIYKLRLFEVADIVLDNCGPIGDAAIIFKSIGAFAPTSTAVGGAILWNVLCGAVEKMLLNGYCPEVFTSSNVDGGDEKNRLLIEKYKKRVKAL